MSTACTALAPCYRISIAITTCTICGSASSRFTIVRSVQLQEPVANAVLQANAYLRNATSGYLGRHFQIYVDLFGPPNQVQTRSYVDDYFVVVTPSAELPVEAIRHAYLHYLLDPLPLKFSKGLLEKRGLGDYAQGSPILEEQYKSDFILLTTECLIKAVESRIDRKPAAGGSGTERGFRAHPGDRRAARDL